MKLKDYREAYYTHSGKASDVARQLGFAGIAIIWTFKSLGTDGAQRLAPDLYLAGELIVISLALDLFQYLSAALIWGLFSRIKEKKGTKTNANITAPPYFNWPAIVFFWLKIAVIGWAYAVLLWYLHSKV